MSHLKSRSTSQFVGQSASRSGNVKGWYQEGTNDEVRQKEKGRTEVLRIGRNKVRMKENVEEKKRRE